MKKGKKILRSKTPKNCDGCIFLIFGGIFIVPYVTLKIFELLNPTYRFTFSFLDFSMILIGVLFLLPGVTNFLSYIVIYENGVKVRKPLNIAEFLSYLIPKFILYDQIEKVNIEKIQLPKRSKDHAISIQLKHDVFSIEISWILNYNEIVNELTHRVSTQKIKQKLIEKPKYKTMITFTKQNREYHGRFSNPSTWTFPEDGKIQIDCQGSGSTLDPIVIDDSLHLPKRVSIKDYNLYFSFENLQLIKLYIENCENFTFSNCEIDLIRMNSCSNIKFIECSIPRDLKLKECQNINFEKCLVKKAIVFKSDDNTLKDCLIIQLSVWMSKNNIYESNKIKELRTNVKQETFNKRNSESKNEIKRKQFKTKKLFPMGFKVFITDKYLWISIFFLVFYIIGLFSILDLISKGQDTGFLVAVYPYLFYVFILLLIIIGTIDEYYYKFKFKIINEAYYNSLIK